MSFEAKCTAILNSSLTFYKRNKATKHTVNGFKFASKNYLFFKFVKVTPLGSDSKDNE